MSRPDFFEPNPLSENIRIKFEEFEPIRRKPVLRRRYGFREQPVSILGKRKLDSAFGFGMNDKERYGQEISPDFFKLNHGHNVLPSPISLRNIPVNIKNYYEDRIKYWREKYLVKR
jgi:hypothetical protein